MATPNPINTDNFKQKSFWSRPEGITGAIFLAGLVLGGGYLFVTLLPTIMLLIQNTLVLAGMLMVLAAIVYMVLDPKMRNLVGYMYKSVMRWITGMFVNIDPIGILKSYVESLEENLRKMSKQIGNLRGQMRKLQTIMEENNKEIDANMKLASMAQQKDNQQQLTLSTRKAARLKESNEKYLALTQKMDIMHKILSKMYQNSEILLEDTKDQVNLKEQEYKAIRASHSAMTSAMSVISGDPDKRAMFDAAMEAVADDVANKVGEMERFMDMSANFMNSVDLQNGVFEEEGLKMLEKFEKESSLLLMGNTSSSSSLDLNSPRATPEPLRKDKGADNNYENLFD
jgi:hypothetical protein